MRDSTDLSFRPFEPPDVEILGPWVRAAELGLPDGVLADDWGRRVVGDPRIVVRVAEDAGGPVGFFRLDLAPDRSAEITIFTDPKRRRKGIGSRVLEEALREIRRLGVRRLLAVVERGNRVAREFFFAAGFEPCESRETGFDHLERIVHGAGQQPPLEITP
jgi:GNAT superfamily N-acetyltransferase